MLTRLQLRVCRIAAELPEAESVALAGGGALIVHGIVDRAPDTTRPTDRLQGTKPAKR